METLKKIFGKGEKPPEEEEPAPRGEIPVMEVTAPEAGGKETGPTLSPILVKTLDLSGSPLVEKILTELRDGNIVISDISPLMDEGPEELKRAVDELKESVGELGGQVARLSESRIIATPKLVRVQFREEG